MTETILSLGTNCGDRALYMREMERACAMILDGPIVKSRLMETEPVGVSGPQEWYYNRLVRGRFAGTPDALLRECLAMEKQLGRTRPARFAPRTADLDILLFGDILVTAPALTIPHPRIAGRRFLLLGLLEIAPEWKMPGTAMRADAFAREHLPSLEGQQVRYPEPAPGTQSVTR